MDVAKEVENIIAGPDNAKDLTLKASIQLTKLANELPDNYAAKRRIDKINKLLARLSHNIE